MIKKSISAVILSVLTVVSTVIPVGALSREEISAHAAVLMEASTGKILFEKNPHEKRPCASITKVMTLIPVFEAVESGKLKLSDQITASEHAASMGGSDIWLEPGETMSADDMIKATVVASANDAAVALAEHLSGSEEAFVSQMNQKAKQLGMKDTVFKNCNGLDEEGHITSAYDVALMSRELIKHKKVFDYTSIWLDQLRGGKTQIVNTNKLLKSYNGITGLKTGTTDDAGCCISATAERGGMSLIAVVLGADTGKQRFADAAALLNSGFADYSVVELKAPKDLPPDVKVNGGMEKSVKLSCKVGGKIVKPNATTDELQVDLDVPDEIDAPVKGQQRVGSVICRIGKETRRFPVVASEQVEKISFPRVFGALMRSMLTM
ncbi:MAG: D-alanyl-D-alanine carboxypeptidase family protein [Ruminococcus sp.]|nr:D-alanyl-D-alanine carboxypeptidase family protein [Ruminococcus sp.]